MNEAKQWIVMDPLDTLFFKGSEPMIAGEGHEVRSTFPPMPSTLSGALCTAILQQRGLKPQDFTHRDGPDQKITEKFPLLGRPTEQGYEPGYKLIGPLFLLNLDEAGHEWLFPAPAHWFGKMSDRPKDGYEVHVVSAVPFPDMARSLGLCGTVDEPIWIIDPPKRDMESMSGYWTNQAGLKALNTGSARLRLRISIECVKPDEPTIMGLGALFANEIRVGIALKDGTRRARKGYLYTTSQVRLKANVRMVVGLSEELIPDYLDKEGILQLGGEQRIVRYQQLARGPDRLEGKSPWMMSLSPFPYRDLRCLGWEGSPRVSGPLIRMGGWDMKKGFHKPMRAYLPAGTVVLAGEVATVPYGFIRI
ncbi:MAG: hypothetical protein JRG73_16765 [Deltaproteobacteria bacterium]|nr:hypothetical protein [Deltaproteobacteria bacterium]MBW2308580.1 hypothetical protein [Deltaproteobacteria bacterium]